MTEAAYEKAVLTSAALQFVPPLIRKSLINDQLFREEHGLTAEAIITFGASGISCQRTTLFNAIRNIFAGQSRAELTDTEGRTWNLENDAREGELPNFVLSSSEERLNLPDFCVLSEDASLRVRSLEEAASDVNLPAGAKEHWRSVLEERALNDEEVDSFYRDIRDTPSYWERTIESEIKSGKSSLSTLVPKSRRYYERLVGAFDGSDTIQNYAVGAAREHFSQLTQWCPYEGFLFSLFLSSHAALTNEISVANLDHESLEHAFSYLETHGDTLSRLGALEVGLRILPDRPEVEPFLLRLVRLIRDDEVEGEASEFNLLSALFILVDGDLARKHILIEQPPFYRRLASLAQAALIQRKIVENSVDYQTIAGWAVNIRGEHYYMQTLADMRIAPCWDPDLAAASQMQADFLGRVMIAGSQFRENLGEGELRDIILGHAEYSFIKNCDYPRAFFSGPLEGSENSPNALPDDLARSIEEQLDSEKIEAASFIALVNSAMIFRITSDHAELAAKALKLANYTLSNLEDKSQLLGILNGLATVAAVSRSSALAEELRILVRRYRRDRQYGFNIENAIRVCLVACAGREDFVEWRAFVGEWLTELAFGDLEDGEGEVFHSRLSTLLHLVPELWISCAKADAALEAFRFR